MKVIKAIIEKANDGGYGIYSNDADGLWGYGLSEFEAKENFIEVLEEQAKYYQEKKGCLPGWYESGYKIDYYYDMSGFFLSFPFINVSEFGKYIGINPSLMRKYKNGLTVAGTKQKELIQRKLQEIVHQMETVKF